MRTRACRGSPDEGGGGGARYARQQRKFRRDGRAVLVVQSVAGGKRRNKWHGTKAGEITARHVHVGEQPGNPVHTSAMPASLCLVPAAQSALLQSVDPDRVRSSRVGAESPRRPPFSAADYPIARARARGSARASRSNLEQRFPLWGRLSYLRRTLLLIARQVTE